MEHPCERFKTGDVVVHASRPEWGEGVVDQASPMQYEGRDAQRLTVKFANKGRVTLNTAVAPLRPKSQEMDMSTRIAEASHVQKGWLASLENRQTDHELHRLSDGMTDPFASPEQRLKATLDSFRYGADARGLIEWACSQTRLNDPLTKYTRHELEEGFGRFQHLREKHLKALVKQLRQKGQLANLNRAAAEQQNPLAKRALERAIRD